MRAASPRYASGKCSDRANLLRALDSICTLPSSITGYIVRQERHVLVECRMLQSLLGNSSFRGETKTLTCVLSSCCRRSLYTVGDSDWNAQVRVHSEPDFQNEESVLEVRSLSFAFSSFLLYAVVRHLLKSKKQEAKSLPWLLRFPLYPRDWRHSARTGVLHLLSNRSRRLCRSHRSFRLLERSTSSSIDLIVVRTARPAVERAAPAENASRTMLRANHERITTLICLDVELQLVVLATTCGIKATNNRISLRR